MRSTVHGSPRLSGTTSRRATKYEQEIDMIEQSILGEGINPLYLPGTSQKPEDVNYLSFSLDYCYKCYVFVEDQNLVITAPKPRRSLAC